MFPIPSNESFGDAHSQLLQHQSQTWNNGTGNSSLLFSGHSLQHQSPLNVGTITWDAGNQPYMKGLPVSDTRVKIIQYSSLKEDEPYNPMGSVQNVGSVIAFHNNVRECVDKDKRRVFVTTDNKTYFSIDRAQQRQNMLDKGYPMYMIDKLDENEK